MSKRGYLCSLYRRYKLIKMKRYATGECTFQCGLAKSERNTAHAGELTQHVQVSSSDKAAQRGKDTSGCLNWEVLRRRSTLPAAMHHSSVGIMLVERSKRRKEDRLCVECQMSTSWQDAAHIKGPYCFRDVDVMGKGAILGKGVGLAPET